jgi:predicted transcriptional regulator
MNARLWENKENVKDKEHILEALGRIVASYVARNEMQPAEVSGFVQQIFSTLCNLHHTPNVRSLPQAPVDIEKSITSEYLVCLEDGKRLKMLKRHLRTSYGLTPEQYRERWSLPMDYPMVAPNYAKKRSALAKNNGLGTSRSRAYQQNSAVSMTGKEADVSEIRSSVAGF